jgi:hypothetical protein
LIAGKRRALSDAIAEDHCDSAPDLRIGITPASMTEAPRKADDRRLT